MASRSDVFPEPFPPQIRVSPAGSSIRACSMHRRFLTSSSRRVMRVWLILAAGRAAPRLGRIHHRDNHGYQDDHWINFGDQCGVQPSQGPSPRPVPRGTSRRDQAYSRDRSQGSHQDGLTPRRLATLAAARGLQRRREGQAMFTRCPSPTLLIVAMLLAIAGYRASYVGVSDAGRSRHEGPPGDG